MIEDLPVALLKDIGAGALVSLTVLLVLLGVLIPRSQHRERIADKDRQIAALQTALDKRDEQVNRLLENDNIVIELLRSIKSEAERRTR